MLRKLNFNWFNYMQYCIDILHKYKLTRILFRNTELQYQLFRTSAHAELTIYCTFKPSGWRDNLHFTSYSFLHCNYGLNLNVMVYECEYIMFEDEEKFEKQMTAVHLFHSKFLQPSSAWKKENSFGFRCLTQLPLKVDV